MISFVNTKTRTAAIPEQADIYHRNKVHKFMKMEFGVYDVVRLGVNTSDYDIALMEFDPEGKVVLVMEVSAKPSGWSWQKFHEVAVEANIVPLQADGIYKVKFVEL